MKKHLVLAGGGHAHLTVLARLDEYTRRGHRVTLVNPDPYHYYSGMGPGLLGGRYAPQEVRFHVRKLVEERGGSFLADQVTGIDAAARRLRLASGAALSYDIVSFNLGSRVRLGGLETGGAGIVAVKPITNLARARAEIEARLATQNLRLLVVGGGPAGVELAGNLRRLTDAAGEAAITLVGGRRLLKGFPEKARHLAVESLSRRGVDVREGVSAQKLSGGEALLTDGRRLGYDYAFLAVGIEPPTVFCDSGLTTGFDGGLLVNRYLQSVASPELFGGGDCIAYAERTLDKVGVYAVRQNPILFHNLLAALENRTLIPFVPQDDYLLILNLGDGRGLFRRKDWVWDGPLAFWLKERLDRRFMKRFQLGGERQEATPAPDSEE